MKINSFKKFSCIVLSTLITTSLLLSHLAGIIPDAVNIVHADETHDHSTWDAWGDEDDENTPMPNEAGSYYLIDNVKLSETWTVPDGTVNLCLNGYSITAVGDFDTITVGANSILNIYDESENNGIITHDENAIGRGIYVDSGELTLFGGNVSGNRTGADGGGVFVDRGGLTISGGNISGNKAAYLGGGVYIGGRLTIYSGTISNNEAGTGGGGVFCTYSPFRMYGGSISGNACINGDGGGLCIGISPITISGGDISGNKTLNGNGGGIYVNNLDTFGNLNISGGTIENNTAIGNEDGVSGFGGGIFIVDGPFYMSGGTINKNSASSDGSNAYIGGYFEPDDNAVIEGGLVSDTHTTICYDANGGIGEMTSQIIIKGNNVNLAPNEFMREDYIFCCWNTKNDGTGTAYADGDVVTVASDEALTLYAQWVAIHKDHDEQDDEEGNCHDGWIAWTEGTSLPSIPGYYYLTTDVTLNGEWNVPAGTTSFCLNGHKIVQSADGHNTIKIPRGATLNLYDVKDNSGVITHLKDDDGLRKGHGVSVDYGTFNMYGGSISGNKITGQYIVGGGIYNLHGVVTISGGKISHNETDWSGGGISTHGGELTISDCEIYDNVAHNDGGGVDIAVNKNVTVIISGGKIYGNKADRYGGGVTIWEGKPEISGGVILGNEASLGGGIYIQDNQELLFSGGVIYDNKAVVAESSRNSGFGGGICSKGKLTLRGGTVTDNTQESEYLPTGYNVLIYPDNGTLVLEGGSTVNGGLYADGFSLVCFYSNEKNDGTDTVASQIVIPGRTNLISNPFIREGYYFSGWNDDAGNSYCDGEDVTLSEHEVLVLYAQWTPIMYTITFVDNEGNVLQSKDVAYDTKPKYTGTTIPTKASNAEFTYTFAGWSDGENEFGLGDELPAVTSDVIYKPVFSREVNEYTIDFVSDGKVISTKDYPYGTAADDIVVPAEPAIASTAQYTYTFEGWSPALEKVTGDVTYTATYKQVVNEYTITFVDDTGNVLQTGKVPYGEMPKFTGPTPVKVEDDKYTYIFSGWNREVTKVTSDATYTATYNATYNATHSETHSETNKSVVNEYTISFVNEDGTVLQTSKVQYGEMPVYSGSTPVIKAADDNYVYTFCGWDQEITKVTGDATYTAVFTKTERTKSYYLKSFTGDGLGGDIIIALGRSEDDANAISYLDRVEADGKELTQDKEYTAVSGSVIITLKKEFLDTLSEGTHTLTVYFKDGITVTLDYKVKHISDEAGSIPSTGEMISKTLFIGGACVLLAVVAAGSVIVMKKKRKTDNA